MSQSYDPREDQTGTYAPATPQTYAPQPGPDVDTAGGGGGWSPYPYGGPSAGDLTRGAGPTVGGRVDVNYWLGQKYANQAKQVEGDYQHNVAGAHKLGQEAIQVAPNAESERQLRAAQEFATRAHGQLGLEQAVSEVARRLSFDQARAYGQAGADKGFIAQSPAAPADSTPAPRSYVPPQLTAPPASWGPMTAPRAQPRSSIAPLPSLLRPLSSTSRTPSDDTDSLLPRFKKGTANVKAKGGKSKGSAPKGEPSGLEAILPALMAAAGGGAGGPAMPAGGGAPPGFAMGDDDITQQNTPGMPSMQDFANFLMGTARVPGYGSGTVDTVPAMLAPHEAVLNRAAADMLGRGTIAALNAHGVQQMKRGMPAS